MSICNIIDKIKKFMSSEYYIYFLAAIVFIFWCTPVGFVGALIVTVCIGFTLFFCDDMRPLVTGLGLVVYGINMVTVERYMMPFIFSAIAPLLFVISGFIYRLVIIKKTNGRFKLGDLGVGLIVMTVICTLGGVIGNFSIWSFSVALLLGGLCFLCYLIMVNGIKVCFKEYIAKLIVTIGLLVFFQLVWFYLTCDDFWYAVKHKQISIGWGISNDIGLVCVIAMPMAIYLSIKSKRTVPCLCIMLVLYMGVLFSLSRGNIMFGTVLLPILIVYSYIRSSNRQTFLITIALALLAVALAFIFFGAQISEVFENMLGLGMDDRGRVELYVKAIERFFKYPLFGVGFYDNTEFLVKTHNTFLQMLESCGIIGFLGSAVYFYSRYKNVLTKLSVFKVFAFATFLLFDLYGLMDLSYFKAYLLFVLYGLAVAGSNEQNATPPFAVYPIDKKNQNGAVNAC